MQELNYTTLQFFVTLSADAQSLTYIFATIFTSWCVHLRVVLTQINTHICLQLYEYGMLNTFLITSIIVSVLDIVLYSKISHTINICIIEDKLLLRNSGKGSAITDYATTLLITQNKSSPFSFSNIKREGFACLQPPSSSHSLDA